MTGREYAAIRKRMGLSQRDLALRLGLATSTVARRELDELPINREAEEALFGLVRMVREWRNWLIESGKSTRKTATDQR